MRVCTKSNFSPISCHGSGPEVSQVPVFKPSGLEDPGTKQHLTLSTARQGEEEVRGDSKPHSQDNGRSVGL